MRIRYVVKNADGKVLERFRTQGAVKDYIRKQKQQLNFRLSIERIPNLSLFSEKKDL